MRRPSSSVTASTRPLAVDLRDGAARAPARRPRRGAGRANQRADLARPAAPRSGSGSASTTVTATPAARAAAATSWPMKPAPTISSRPPPASSSRSAQRVLERAQRGDVLAARRTPAACAARAPVAITSCVVAQRLAVVEQQAPAGARRARSRARAEQQLDLLLGVPLRRRGSATRSPRPRRRRAPPWRAAGDRRAGARLGADDADAPLVAERAAASPRSAAPRGRRRRSPRPAPALRSRHGGISATRGSDAGVSGVAGSVPAAHRAS